MRAIRPPLVLALLLVLGACGGGSGTGSINEVTAVDGMEAALAAKGAATARPASITLPASTVAQLGTPLQLVPVVKDKTGKTLNGVALAWSVADTGVASVAANGQVTLLRAGFSAVTASASGLSASTALSVRGPAPVPVRSAYVGTNLAGIAYWSTQFPFANLAKNGMAWTSREDNGTWGAAFAGLTADGYPAALKTGQHAVSAVAWNDTHYPTGKYVLLWDGTGQVSMPMSDVAIASPAPNRIEATVRSNTGALWVSIDSTSPTDPVRNLRVLLPGTEATYASQPFNPVFLQKTAPFSTLRFMDWGATNGSPLVQWANRAHVTDASYATPAGVPLEVMIDLANSLHADPWFCIPHQASDDYVKQFATLVRDRLDPALRAHIEYSNEVWNTGFPQTGWAVAQSAALGLPTAYGQPAAFYAKRSVEVFKIAQGVFGSSATTRLVRVLAGQAVWTNFMQGALAVTGTATNADVLAIAPYFNAEGAGVVADVATTLTLTSDQIVDQMFASVRGPVKTAITQNAALAKQYGLRLVAYESGPVDTTYQFPADRIDAMTALFTAANRNPRMRTLYGEYYGQWMASGGTTMNQYADVGAWSRYGFWGALEHVWQDSSTAPKYQGLLDFIAAHPATP